MSKRAWEFWITCQCFCWWWWSSFIKTGLLLMDWWYKSQLCISSASVAAGTKTVPDLHPHCKGVYKAKWWFLKGSSILLLSMSRVMCPCIDSKHSNCKAQLIVNGALQYGNDQCKTRNSLNVRIHVHVHDLKIHRVNSSLLQTLWFQIF